MFLKKKLFFQLEKYRYFATFDQQILAEKLVFRILQHHFSRGSICKMIVVFHFELLRIPLKKTCIPMWLKAHMTVDLKEKILTIP